MTLLEDRLAAAGDQLDDLIHHRHEHGFEPLDGHRHGLGPATGSSRRRPALVAAAAVAVMAAGLLWSTTRQAPDTPVADEVPTTAVPIPSSTDVAIEPGSSGCGIAERDLVVVASTTDSEGRFVEYRVADLPDAFEEQLRFFAEGRMIGWSGGCDREVSLSAAHPTGVWTNAASQTSATQTEVYVHGKLPAGSGSHEVTLSTGDAVLVTPTADGWFLTAAVIAPADDVQAVATTPVVSPRAEPTTTLPVPDRPPLAIGESVMLGAAPQLATGGFVVNADVSRQVEIAADIIGEYRAAGQIGRTIVIHVGTNGPVSQAAYDEIMSYLPPEEVEQVIFLTVSAPRSWIEPNNALIWGLQGRYPNVKVLDWAGFVVSGQVPGLAGDGIHLGTDAAKQWYANIIFDVMGRRDLIQPLPE